MKKEGTSENAIEHVSKYVDERIAGSNKMESAQRAGYSASTSRTPSLIEATNAYAVIVTETLNDNSKAMRQLMRMINEDVHNDLFLALPTLTKVEIAYKLARIHDTLTPKVTVKETTDSKGNKTRTAWGTGGAPLNVNTNNEQG